MRIRQIVFAAAELGVARDILAQVLDLPAPYRDPGVAEFGIDNAVFCLGDQFVEVVSPTRDGTACGRHLSRQGDSGYMLILQTDDLARETARFAELGVRSVWQSTHDDISATHLHPKDVGGAIVSVDEPRPAASWRWGGPAWQVAEGLAGGQRVRGITLNAAEPEAMARRWAQVFGLAAPVAQGLAFRLALDNGFADFVPLADGGDGREGVAGFTLAMADPEAVLARARLAGLAVHDEGRALTLLGATLSLVPLTEILPQTAA